MQARLMVLEIAARIKLQAIAEHTQAGPQCTERLRRRNFTISHGRARRRRSHMKKGALPAPLLLDAESNHSWYIQKRL